MDIVEYEEGCVDSYEEEFGWLFMYIVIWVGKMECVVIFIKEGVGEFYYNK